VAIGFKATITVNSSVITTFSVPLDNSHINLTFSDSTSKIKAFIVTEPTSVLRSANLAQDLGVELTPQIDIKTTATLGEMSVTGCFAAGDSSNQFKSIPGAIHSGSNAAAGAASHVHSSLYGHKSLGDYLREMQSTKPSDE